MEKFQLSKGSRRKINLLRGEKSKKEGEKGEEREEGKESRRKKRGVKEDKSFNLFYLTSTNSRLILAILSFNFISLSFTFSSHISSSSSSII